MARKARSAGDIMRRYDSLEDRELVAAVSRRFCAGESPTQIREGIAAEFKEGVEGGPKRTLSREEPYQILSFAAMQGWLQFVPPVEYALGAKLKDDYPWLQGVDVVPSDSLDHVAARAARMLLQLVRQAAHESGSKKVHVGLAGGLTILKTVEHFGQLLRQPSAALPKDLPKELCFHAMVTGLQLHDPRTDPNTFFNYLSGLQVETDFIALHGPALPTREMIEELKENHDPTQEAFRLGKQIDIIVTSGSSWKACKHSQLKALMRKEEVRALEENHACAIDLLWHPANEVGPIPNETRVRAMTLMGLDQLPGAIKEEGKKVLLVLGPCSSCCTARDDVLRTALGMEDHHFTHLVADSRTARV